MDLRTRKEDGFAEFGSKYGKFNLLRFDRGDCRYVRPMRLQEFFSSVGREHEWHVDLRNLFAANC